MPNPADCDQPSARSTPACDVPDVIDGAKIQQRRIIQGFDQVQLDGGDPCYASPEE